MVGFGSSLRIAKRSGWERAYLDYETLKLLLSQIEAVYEEEGHRRTHGNTGDGFNEGSPRMSGGGGANRRRKRGGAGDYRDELFLESDSDLAFASSASDVFGGTEQSSDEGLGEAAEQGRVVPKQGTAGQAKPFTLTYSQEDVSSSEGDDDDEVGGMGECGTTLTRAWRRGDKNAVVGKPSKPKKKNKRRDDATDFFVGGNFLIGNDEQTENADSQAQQSYSSSLLNTSFQHGNYTTEQTSLLPQSQSSTSQTASFYSFPTSGRTDSNITPPRDFSGGATGAGWSTLGTHVETFPKTTANPPPRPPQTAAEIRRNKRVEERRRKRRQRRRRRIAKQRRLMEQRVPRHLRVAHGKARAITERFLGLLRAEVEKVTLFAQARLGELADTAGSLRFPSYDDSEYGGSFSESFPGSRPGRTRDPYEVLSDGGMHPSASSSEDDTMGRRRGPFPWSESEEEEMSEGGRNPHSPTHARKLHKSYSAGGISVSTEHRTNVGQKGRKEKTDSGRRKSEKGGGKRDDSTQNNKALHAAQRQIAHFEELRQSRPVFQRNDQIVGEDLLLLSAVDEADGYTALGVELMHVLRFICVNVIAVRKICLKHDRLLANRMLGGYYHRQQRVAAENRQKKRKQKAGDSRKDKLQNPVTLGGILSTSVGDGNESESASTRKRERNKLVGVYDSKIQNLANSTTVQVISSCLALALSEYEVSRSRANALARLNSSSNMAKTPLRRGSNELGRTLPFGLSPSRWVAKAYGYEPPKQLDESLEDAESSMASHDDDGAGPPSTTSSVSLTRLRFTVVSIFGLREAARPKEDTYTSFLSKTSLVFPGPIGEGLDGCSRETLDFFVSYNPDVALLLDPSFLYKGLRAGRWWRCPIESVMVSTLATASTAIKPASSAEYVSQPDDTDLVMNALSISPDSDGQARLGLVSKERSTERTASQAHDGGKDIYSPTLSLNCTSLLLYTVSSNYHGGRIDSTTCD